MRFKKKVDYGEIKQRKIFKLAIINIQSPDIPHELNTFLQDKNDFDYCVKKFTSLGDILIFQNARGNSPDMKEFYFPEAFVFAGYYFKLRIVIHYIQNDNINHFSALAYTYDNQEDSSIFIDDHRLITGCQDPTRTYMAVYLKAIKIENSNSDYSDDFQEEEDQLSKYYKNPRPTIEGEKSKNFKESNIFKRAFLDPALFVRNLLFHDEEVDRLLEQFNYFIH